MIQRRAWLRTLGLGALAAPFVPLLPSRAGTQPAVQRVLFVHFGHGVAYDQWLPPQNDGALVLSPILAPLSAYRDRTIVIEGLANAVGRDQIGDVHNIGLGTLLTSTGLAADQGAGGHYLPGGPSIDRVLGEGLVAASGADAPPHPALHFGVRSQGFALSAVDRGVPMRAQDDPTAQYQRLFGELSLDPSARAQVQQARADARRYVQARLDTLSHTLGAQDRQTLQRHRDAVERLEARAAQPHPLPATCTLPSAPTTIEHATQPDNADIPALIDATSDLVTAAFACDLTRVATLQWGSSGNDGLRHTWQGIEGDYHSTAHLANGADATAHAQMAAMNTWYSEQLAALAGRLDAIDEGDGTLLDHTLIVYLSGFSIVHDLRNLPVVLLGGGLNGARHLRYDGASHTGLWRSLALHLGLTGITAFGDPMYDDGPLVGLL